MIKYLALLLLFPALTHAQTFVIFGSAGSCTGSTTMSLCNNILTNNPLYAIDSIQRTNNGIVTINVNNMAYKGSVNFITDQVLQQNCCGHDGLVALHIDSILMTNRLGGTLLLSLKVTQQQHSGGGPSIKQHYVQNTYIVNNGQVQLP